MRAMRIKNGELGFTLIELLVAMAITLVLILGTLSVFDSATRANEAGTQLANMNQNLRAGMNLMVRDFLQTGQGIPIGGIVIPNGAGALPINRPNPPNVASYTFNPAFTALPALVPGDALGPQNANTLNAATDIVTLIYADAALPLVSTRGLPTSQFVTVAANGSSITVDAANPIGGGINNPVVAGDIIMITCPQGSRIQTVSSVNGQVINFNAGDAFNLNQRGVASGSVMDLIATCGAPQPPTASPYTALRINMFTYFLDTTARAHIPRLVRRYNFKPGRSVAEVIENLQVSYDFVDGVTNPTDQPFVPVGLSENQIRKVNLSLSGRSDQPYSANQQYFRNSLETQVSLRSLAFVNRYQ